jgi:hypothetical protein
MSEVLRELASKDWKLVKQNGKGDTVQVLKDGLTGTVYLLTVSKTYSTTLLVRSS